MYKIFGSLYFTFYSMYIKIFCIYVLIRFVFLSNLSYALGIGEIVVNSSLNSILNAEIMILYSHENELSNIKIGLASEDDYQQAGIKKDEFLDKLKFELKDGSKGKFIHVQSQEPINLPYINLLIKVESREVNLSKLFKVLLDPSDYVDSQETVSSQRFYIVKPKQTIWELGHLIQQTGASLYQIVAALFNKNPDAFINNDINLLKVGSKLLLPSYEEINSIPVYSAIQLLQKLHLNLNRKLFSAKLKENFLIENQNFLFTNEFTQDKDIVSKHNTILPYRYVKPTTKKIRDELLKALEINKVHEYALLHQSSSLRLAYEEFNIPRYTHLLNTQSLEDAEGMLEYHHLSTLFNSVNEGELTKIQETSTHSLREIDTDANSKLQNINNTFHKSDNKSISVHENKMLDSQDSVIKKEKLIPVNSFLIPEILYSIYCLVLLMLILMFLIRENRLKRISIQSKNKNPHIKWNKYPVNFYNLLKKLLHIGKYKDALLLASHELKYNNISLHSLIRLIQSFDKFGHSGKIIPLFSSNTPTSLSSGRNEAYIIKAEMNPKHSGNSLNTEPESVDLSLMSDTDLISTKLNLATAYISMGKYKEATKILEEVKQGGNSQQQNEANNLIKKISSIHIQGI